jgi:hypothetical protein
MKLFVEIIVCISTLFILCGGTKEFDMGITAASFSAATSFREDKFTSIFLQDSRQKLLHLSEPLRTWEKHWYMFSLFSTLSQYTATQVKQKLFFSFEVLFSLNYYSANLGN